MKLYPGSRAYLELMSERFRHERINHYRRRGISDSEACRRAAVDVTQAIALYRREQLERYGVTVPLPGAPDVETVV